MQLFRMKVAQRTLIFIFLLMHAHVITLESSEVPVVVAGVNRTLVQCEASDESPNINSGSKAVSGDLQSCTKKLVILVDLVDIGQASNDDIYIDISQVQDESGDVITLYHPLVIQIKQEPATVAYPFKYLQSVNHKPHEVVFSQKQSEDYPGCLDTGSVQDLCATLSQGPTYRAGATGFCCGCHDYSPEGPSKADNLLDADSDSVSHLREHEERSTRHSNHAECRTGETVYDNPVAYTSAHCLRLDPLWHSVNMVQEPHLHHSIQFKVYRETMSDQESLWKSMTGQDLVVGTENRVSSSSNRKIVASYKTDTTPDIEPLNPQRDRLLVPEPVISPGVHKPVQLKSGPETFLVLDKMFLEGDGTRCNRVGVSYPAYLSQEERCRQNVNSCLTENQPFYFWQKNQEFLEANQPAIHQLGSKGQLANPALVHSRTTGENRVHFLHKGEHRAVLEVQIDADDMLLLHAGLHTEISQITVCPTTMSVTLLSTIDISVLVTNMGLVSAEYSVRLVHCSTHIGHSLVRKVTVLPKMSDEAVFVLHIDEKESSMNTENNTCTVEVQHPGNTVVATRQFWFLLNDRCLCVAHCQCTCMSQHDLSCHPLSTETYNAAGFKESGEIWSYKPHMKLFQGWQLTAIPVIGLFGLGFLKAVIGLTISKDVGLFGLHTCLVKNNRYDDVNLGLLFMLNILFIPICPGLFVYWLCHKISSTKLKQNTSYQQIPLLPKKQWSEILENKTHPVYEAIPSPIIPSSPRVSAKNPPVKVLEDFYKHKPELQRSLNESEDFDEHDEDADDNLVVSELDQTTTESVASFLQPGRMVYCNFEQPSAYITNSGSLYSLCGQLSQIDSDLYQFSIELNRTQVYENRKGRVTSLTELQSLQPELLTHVFNLQEVQSCITDTPRYPCLNKLI